MEGETCAAAASSRLLVRASCCSARTRVQSIALRAAPDALRELHARALGVGGVAVIAFPALGQTTTDYDASRDAVGSVPTGELVFAAVLVAGPAKAVRRLTGSFGLLR